MPIDDIRAFLAEDDFKLCQLLKKVLVKNGYFVTTVTNGKEALDTLNADYYDLLITDVMMPVIDGYELVSTIRDSGSTLPILVITAKSEFEDMRIAFLRGTDDFMVKPISVNEMVIRVGALLRRAQMIHERRQIIGDTTLDCDSLTITTTEESLILPQKEFMLLYKMISYPGRIFTRQELMNDIWGYSTNSDFHTVDVHIGRLRDKFRDNKDFEIITIRGIGYKVIKK